MSVELVLEVLAEELAIGEWYMVSGRPGCLDQVRRCQGWDFAAGQLAAEIIDSELGGGHRRVLELLVRITERTGACSSCSCA